MSLTTSAASARRTVAVAIRFSREDEKRFLANVSQLGCTKSDYIRFALRLACEGRIPPAALRRLIQRPSSYSRGADRKDRPAYARIDAALYRRACERAESLDAPFSAWARAALVIPVKVDERAADAVRFIRVGEAKGELAGLRREVQRIGQNCNQIAHAMNVCKNKHWLPADHAEGIFNNANDVLGRMTVRLERIADAVSEGLSILDEADGGIAPAKAARGENR